PPATHPSSLHDALPISCAVLLQSEQAARFEQGGNQRVDVIPAVVKRKRRTGGAGQTKAGHQTHSAVVTSTNGDSFHIQYGSEVVRMNVGHNEGRDGGAVGGLSNETQAGNARQGLYRVLKQRILMGGDSLQPNLFDISYGGIQAHHA